MTNKSCYIYGGPTKRGLFWVADGRTTEEQSLHSTEAEAMDECAERNKQGKPDTDVAAILEERGKRYGKFKDHANVTQQLKNVIFGFNPAIALEPDQKEALEMIAHKIGRIVNGDPHYADSWVDIAGYAQLVADRLGGVER